MIMLAILTVMAAGLCWARCRLVRVQVAGQSMQPTLNDGDVVLVRRARRHRPRPGQIVVAEVPPAPHRWDLLLPASRQVAGRSWMVKRVTALAGRQVPAPMEPGPAGYGLPPDTVFLMGDNPASRDSRHFGPCPADRLLGVVVCILHRSR